MHARLLPLLAVAASLAAPAVAQPAFAQPAATQPAFAQPAATQPAATQPAATQPPGWVPAGANPATGARPGNDIGTGMSLPMSDHAGNITPQDTASPIAARLPEPPVGDEAAIHDYLLAARNALAAGRSGEAQEALEMAETRALDRSVPLFQTGVPSDNPMVARITQVLHTLGNGDRLEAMRLLEQAIAAGGS
jgi:hypothetical protein